MSKDTSTNAWCPFPSSDWMPRFVNLYQTPSPLLRPDWLTQIKLDPPPSDCAAECAALLALKAERRARNGEIVAQARTQSDQAFWPVQAIIGSPKLPPHMATLALVATLMGHLEGPLFTLKRQFNRGRPLHCCAAGLDPMFPPGDPDHPGHPAYPSGHSTQAHALAGLYATMFPQHEVALMNEAARIAENREVAGLHYPSDTAAGKALAAQLLAMLLDNPDFQDLVRAARSEWP